MGNYETIERFCEATNHLLEIIKRQEEIIQQYHISEAVEKELEDMRKNSDREMNLLEYALRSKR